MAAPRTEQLMHLVRAREEAMGELAAQDLARSQYSRDIIPSQASAFKQQRPNANVGAIERQKLENETRVVGGVLARMFPWMYQKPADEKGKTNIARMQVKQADMAEKTHQAVQKGNSILGSMLKSWVSGILLWSLLKEPLTKFYNDVIVPWWENSKNPVVRVIKDIIAWGEKVLEWIKGPFWEWLKGVVKGIKDFIAMLPEILGTLFNILQSMWDNLKKWFNSSFLPNFKLAIANLLTAFAGLLDKIFEGRTLFQVLKHALQEGITIPLLNLLKTAMTPAVYNPLPTQQHKIMSPRQPLFPDAQPKIDAIKKEIQEEKDAAKKRPGVQDWLAKQKFMDWLDPGDKYPGVERMPGQTFGGTPKWDLPNLIDIWDKVKILNIKDKLKNLFPPFPSDSWPGPITWTPASGDRGARGAPGITGAPGMPGGGAVVVPLGSGGASGTSIADTELQNQTDILTQIERNTRAGAAGNGNQVVVAPGQRSGGRGTNEGSNVVATNVPSMGPPKLDSRAGLVNSLYSINSNFVLT